MIYISANYSTEAQLHFPFTCVELDLKIMYDFKQVRSISLKYNIFHFA